MKRFLFFLVVLLGLSVACGKKAPPKPMDSNVATTEISSDVPRP